MSWKPRWYTCEQCGKRFLRSPSNDKRTGRPRPCRFCGDPCYRAWQRENPINAGCLKPGLRPWNTGMKGLCHPGSVKTQFKKGNSPQTLLPVGTLVIRHPKDNKTPQAWIKIAEPNVWKSRASINWEAAGNPPVPKGMLLYHTNGDPLHDDVGNLELLTRAENLARLREKLTPEAYRRMGLKAWETRKAKAEKKTQAEASKASRGLPPALPPTPQPPPAPKITTKQLCLECFDMKPRNDFLYKGKRCSECRDRILQEAAATC